MVPSILIMPRKVQVTIVSREAGQVIDSVLDSILNDIFPQPAMQTEQDPTWSLKDRLEHQEFPNYGIIQGKCYQQHVGNFCGYHASFAYVCVLQALEGRQDRYNIQSAASFWTFKRRIEDFLFEYRSRCKLDASVWPWRDNDILYGDFERTYNQVLRNHSHIFLDFINEQKMQVMEHTWEFQYKNLVSSQDSRKKLSAKINSFRKYKKLKPLVFVMMLGITNHWTCLIAYKHKENTQFWFFDSKNTHYLDFSVVEISVYLAAINQQRLNDGKEALKPFMHQIYSQSILDIQISLRLLVRLFKGEERIETYCTNRLFEVFSQSYEKLMSMNPESQEYAERLTVWTGEYKHNLRSFFLGPVDPQQFYQCNRTTFAHMVRHIKKYQKRSRDLQVVSNYIEGANL